MEKESYPQFLCGLVWITVYKSNLVTIMRQKDTKFSLNMCISLYTVEKGINKGFLF